MINYPNFNPVALSLGPLRIYWYGIMYLLAFFLAYIIASMRVKKYKLSWKKTELEDLVFYCAIGVILGGRLGYMLFYSNGAWLHNPLLIFKIWEGGMAFHGGVIGVGAALYLFARKTQRSFLAVTDFTAPLVPLGLALGRVGNFINGELWGRVTNLPWSMVFPHAGFMPRHPSQLYEAALEGILLFIIVFKYAEKPRNDGYVTAVFLMGYALCRIIVEFFRQPDLQLGFLAFGWLTMGQLLSVPLFAIGAYLWWRKT
ncbi:MAG: prolipoprotein diacylglyceryl transferase [Legionellales bacterium RIFCSPHIGHO2_12_FULL_37_14]|nr:MAG: prolipoprotein diacylglyceryl transferase [Legionellales bacterium RIFCSPHIGHO2_12_FULL_37_14]